MKYFLATTIMLIFLNGCSHNNAFTKFQMNQEQERSVSSLQNSKIINKDGIAGIFSAIYLNDVYPKSFYKDEYFYISVYLKKKTALTFLLNGKSPLEIKKLSSHNQFSHLLSRTNDWNMYYLVTFKPQGKTLSLVLKENNASSPALLYYKDEQ